MIDAGWIPMVQAPPSPALLVPPPWPRSFPFVSEDGRRRRPCQWPRGSAHRRREGNFPAVLAAAAAAVGQQLVTVSDKYRGLWSSSVFAPLLGERGRGRVTWEPSLSPLVFGKLAAGPRRRREAVVTREATVFLLPRRRRRDVTAQAHFMWSGHVTSP